MLSPKDGAEVHCVETKAGVIQFSHGFYHSLVAESFLGLLEMTGEWKGGWPSVIKNHIQHKHKEGKDE